MASDDSAPNERRTPRQDAFLQDAFLQGTQSWSHVVQSLGAAAMLLAIEARLGRELKERVQAEDIWQETLMHAWRDRARCQAKDLAGFRRWLLGIAENRIRDALDFHRAQKRDGGRERPLVRPGSVGDGSWQCEPSGSTTPSRLMVQREQADQMAKAMHQVPSEMRDVLQLRLFDCLTMPEIAVRLQIGESAAKHRYRKGAEIYRKHLQPRLRSPSERDS